MVVHTEHCEDGEPVRDYVENCVHEIGSQVAMHCEAWGPKDHDQCVADYSNSVAHCKDYQRGPYLGNLVQKGGVIETENTADGLEQVEGRYSHQDDSDKVKESLSGEFNADGDRFVEGDETLKEYHKREPSHKKVVKNFLFPLYILKLRHFTWRASICCYVNLHFLEFKGNLGQNLGMANS